MSIFAHAFIAQELVGGGVKAIVHLAAQGGGVLQIGGSVEQKSVQITIQVVVKKGTLGSKTIVIQSIDLGRFFKAGAVGFLIDEQQVM